jgi:hypothetical protein
VRTAQTQWWVHETGEARDHPSAAQRGCPHRRTGDPHILRGRDLPRQRAVLRQAGDGGQPRQRAAPSWSGAPASLRAGGRRLRSLRSQSGTRAATAGRWTPSQTGPECSTSAPGLAGWPRNSPRRGCTTAVVDIVAPTHMTPGVVNPRGGSERRAQSADRRFRLLTDAGRDRASQGS